MRTFYSLAALICLILMGSTQAFAALCNPNTGATCHGLACDKLGLTTMDGDQKSILACLKNDAGSGYIWKSQSAPSLTCPTGQAVTKIENGKAVCEAVGGGLTPTSAYKKYSHTTTGWIAIGKHNICSLAGVSFSGGLSASILRSCELSRDNSGNWSLYALAANQIKCDAICLD